MFLGCPIHSHHRKLRKLTPTDFSREQLAQLACTRTPDFDVDVHTEAVSVEREVLACHHRARHTKPGPRKQTMSEAT